MGIFRATFLVSVVSISLLFALSAAQSGDTAEDYTDDVVDYEWEDLDSYEIDNDFWNYDVNIENKLSEVNLMMF